MGVSLFSAGMIQLWFCRLLSLLGHVISAGSGDAAPIDKSFVLEYLVVEELSPETVIGVVPRDYQLNRKYSPATLEELRFRFLSRPGVGDRALFAVDEKTGVLRTADRIDREVICPGLTECFVAFDVAVHPMVYFQIIKIRVEIVDVNDNAPVFPQPTVRPRYSVSVQLGAAACRGRDGSRRTAQDRRPRGRRGCGGLGGRRCGAAAGAERRRTDDDRGVRPVRRLRVRLRRRRLRCSLRPEARQAISRPTTGSSSHWRRVDRQPADDDVTHQRLGDDVR